MSLRSRKLRWLRQRTVSDELEAEHVACADKVTCITLASIISIVSKL